MTTPPGLHRARAVRNASRFGEEAVRQRRTAQPIAWPFIADQTWEK